MSSCFFHISCPQFNEFSCCQFLLVVVVGQSEQKIIGKSSVTQQIDPNSSLNMYEDLHL